MKLEAHSSALILSLISFTLNLKQDMQSFIFIYQNAESTESKIINDGCLATIDLKHQIKFVILFFWVGDDVDLYNFFRYRNNIQTQKSKILRDLDETFILKMLCYLAKEKILIIIWQKVHQKMLALI